MATHIITIYATQEKPYPLSIGDDEGHLSSTDKGDKAIETLVYQGDTILWTINPKSAIERIDDIKISDTSFIESEPSKSTKFPGSWTCKIKSGKESITGWTEYTITYTVRGVTFVQDPKLQIRKKEIKQ